ncbi:MAG: hypothetical protein ACRCYO_08740 [Bacteroidia bacterium]
MKNNLLLFFVFTLVSCSNVHKEQKPQANDSDPHAAKSNDTFIHEKKTFDSDTVGTWIPDNYPITEAMLRENRKAVYKKTLKTYDDILFIDSTSKQFILFSLGTDYHVSVIFHFYYASLPLLVNERLPIYFRNGSMINKRSKRRKADESAPLGKKIAPHYFISEKGIRLGNSKQKLIQLYGLPDSTSTHEEIEYCEWNYEGDILYPDNKKHLNNPHLAKNSFGHQVSLFFKHEKLVGIILTNHEP